MAPSDLPLEALTHLNYAFAYIDPTTFTLVTMDQQTPKELFQEVVDVKQYKSDLQVWISVGGWTFSDNGTATQPVFGNIAGSAANRQAFADNVVAFLTHYGFDGIDLDWEYPGAPDRGGIPDDTKNYVALLETLRSTFDRAPRTLGITFTAPSSYCDLHGVWDRNNPIGSIIQGHTNLTEIKLAAELLWRVNIPASKVVMAFGFYGRSFQLSDLSCSTPGCQFSGGGSAGPCSATSGILYYYEIQALLKQHTDLKPIWDKDAAVKYVVYDKNQWISYDDPDTFKQKVEWANSVGLGGSLIWASDTDDAEYTAHSGLIGKAVGTLEHADITLSQHAIAEDAGAIAQNLIGQNGQSCTIQDTCRYQDEFPRLGLCPGGQTFVGGNQSVVQAPQHQNHAFGEVGAAKRMIAMGNAMLGRRQSSGLPGVVFPQRQTRRSVDEDTKCFVVKQEIGVTLHLGVIGLSVEVHAQIPRSRSVPEQKNRARFSILLENIAAQSQLCSMTALGSRKKTNCCKVRSRPPAALTCDVSICDADPPLCRDTASVGLMKKRDFFTLDNGLSVAEPLYTDDLEPEDEGDEYSILEKRKKISVTFELLGRAAIIVFARPHPSRAQLFASALRLRTVIRQFFHLEHTQCDDTAITGVDLPTPNQASTLPRTGETEHPIDLSIHKRFVRCAERGILPDGSATENSGLGAAFFADQYLAENMLRQGLPLVTPNSAQYRSTYMRVWEAFGSTTNAAQFVLTDKEINGPKGRVMNLGVVTGIPQFEIWVNQGTAGNGTATESFLQSLRTAIGVFKYLQNTDVAARFQNTRDLIREQLEIIEAELPGATGLVALWDECFEAILREIERTAQEWLLARVNQARQIYTQVGPTPRNRASVFTTLTSLERQIMSVYIPGSR
ncbi:uncharacterized protein RCO7_10835 [Rhynchosporium graminicola]|uniref:chitinase n=1 Tax=Rhynchosporium graminicola TaxID=2792576 RepID=A0A1E1LSW9_9HELO|nr:uncharacterized protein RCO7_10835 [Rhynchosporium commune]